MSIFILPAVQLAQQIEALDALGEHGAAKLLRAMQPLANQPIRRETRRDRAFSIKECKR
jgi:hypothetical protein